MEKEISVAIIAAGATLGASIIALVPYFRKQVQEQKEKTAQAQGNAEEATRKAPVRTDVTLERQSFVIDIDILGKVSVCRRDFIRHVSGGPEVTSKKVGWIVDKKGLENYLAKRGKSRLDTDLNDEFGISVYDPGTHTYFPTPTTVLESPPGKDYEILSSLFKFHRSLNEDNRDLEYEVRYKSLHVDLTFGDFWYKQADWWVTLCTESLKELITEIILPDSLPSDKWRQFSDFGFVQTPVNWATHEVARQSGKIKILIKNRSELQPNEYRILIDGRK